ncbi:MAG: methyltransferase domain-containing protein [Candidatus Binatia bacterium]
MRQGLILFEFLREFLLEFFAARAPHGCPPVARASLVVAAVALAIGVACGAWAEQAPTDGATSHRKFDDVVHWGKVFDDPARDQWQKPDHIVDALGLRPGMGVADIGAGTGYFSRRLSVAVGQSGAVYVVEVEPNLVAHMRDRADAEKTANVVPVLASADNPRLPPASIDVALFVDAWHHVDARRAYLAVLRRALRPGGRIGVVEWKPGKQPQGPKEEDHKVPRETVIGEMTAGGFELVETPDFLPHQYFLLFRMAAEPMEPPK